MKKFQDLKLLIGTQKEGKLAFLLRLKENLPIGWKFQQHLLDNYQRNTGMSPKEFGVILSPSIKGKKGNIWLRVDNDAIKIMNIVPESSGELNYEEYNLILNRFLDDCIKKIEGFENIQFEMSMDDISMQEILPAHVFQKLSIWELSCNKSSGNTHPMDSRRWIDFVISLHESLLHEIEMEAQQFIEIFSRWLLEEKQEWNGHEDVVYKLISELEYGLELLESYDRK